VLIVFVSIILIWIFCPILLDEYLLPLLGIHPNEVGSLYTAVAALFSALAFAAILLTLWLQKQQLDNQLKQNEINTDISAYTALLTYYSSNSYDPKACELTSMQIAKRLNKLLSNPSRATK
jgi:hypothetical protein